MNSPDHKKKYFYLIYFIIAVILEVIVVGYLKRVHPEYLFVPLATEDTSKGIVHVLELTLALIYGFLGLFFTLKELDTSNDLQKTFFKALGIFFICAGIAQGFSLTNSFVRKSATIQHSIMPQLPSISLDGTLIVVFLLVIAALIPLSRALDMFLIAGGSKKIAQRLNIFGTITTLIVFVDYFVLLPLYLTWLLIGLGLIILFVLIFTLVILYFRIGLQSMGTLRRVSLAISVGYFLTFFGLLLHLIRSNIEFPYNYIAFLIMNVIGLIILVYGYLNVGENK